jgi:hypothetical protein
LHNIRFSPPIIQSKFKFRIRLTSKIRELVLLADSPKRSRSDWLHNSSRGRRRAIYLAKFRTRKQTGTSNARWFQYQKPHFTDTLYSSFIAATKRRLESCNITFTLLEFNKLDLDMNSKIAKSVNWVNPDAVVPFIYVSGNPTVGRSYTKGYLNFGVEAIDPK